MENQQLEANQLGQPQTDGMQEHAGNMMMKVEGHTAQGGTPVEDSIPMRQMLQLNIHGSTQEEGAAPAYTNTATTE